MIRIAPRFSGRLASTFLFFAMAVMGWKFTPGEVALQRKIDSLPSSLRSRDRDLQSLSPSKQASNWLDRIYEHDSTAGKMRSVLALVDSLSAEQLFQWLDRGWFINRGGVEFEFFKTLAVEKLSREDPERLLMWSIQNPGYDSEPAITALASFDPQRLIEIVAEHPEPSMEWVALTRISETDPSLAISRLKEISTSGLLPKGASMPAELFASLAKSSPDELQAALKSMPDRMRFAAESAMVAQRLQQDFDQEFLRLTELPDGWKFIAECSRNFPTDTTRKLISNLADLPADWRSNLAKNPARLIHAGNAEQWSRANLEEKNFTIKEAASIRFQCIAATANKNPEAALNALNDSGLETISAQQREALIQDLLTGYRNDPEQLNRLAAVLDRDSDRQAALKSPDVEPIMNEDQSLRKIKTAEEWIAQAITAIQPGDRSSEYLYLEAIQGWDDTQTQQLEIQLQKLPTETGKKIAMLLTTQSGPSIDPELKGHAIDFLVSQSSSASTGEKSEAVKIASNHAAKWAQIDPASASHWVDALPPGDAKSWAMKNLVATWNQYDPAAAEKWVGTLPENLRLELKASSNND